MSLSTEHGDTERGKGTAIMKFAMSESERGSISAVKIMAVMISAIPSPPLS